MQIDHQNLFILSTEDDPTPISMKSGKDELALASERGEKYRQLERNNEDRVASGSFLVNSSEVFVDLVCDGLGGYQQGAKASQLFCESLQELVSSSFEGLEDPEEMTLHVLKKVLQKYEEEDFAPEAGTTFVLAFRQEQKLSIFHIGDSEAFVFRPDGSLLLHTKSHKPKGFEDRFRLTAYVHRTDSAELENQLRKQELKFSVADPLILILASDGITDNLIASAEERTCIPLLQKLLINHSGAVELCQSIMRQASERMQLSGSEQGKAFDVKPDNLSCLVRVFSCNR